MGRSPDAHAGQRECGTVRAMQLRAANFGDALGPRYAGPMKSHFRDRYELRSYARIVLLARRLLDSPELVGRGRAYLDQFMAGDPHQRQAVEAWRAALEAPVDQLVALLLADDPRSAALRETAPVFTTISPQAVSELVDAAA